MRSINYANNLLFYTSYCILCFSENSKKSQMFDKKQNVTEKTKQNKKRIFGMLPEDMVHTRDSSCVRTPVSGTYQPDSRCNPCKSRPSSTSRHRIRRACHVTAHTRAFGVVPCDISCIVGNVCRAWRRSHPTGRKERI